MTQRRIYQDEYPYFVTFNIKEGLPIFEETKYAKLLSQIIFNAGKLKEFDILACQIMSEHVHLFTWQNHPDRTLERVRSAGEKTKPERTFSNVRSGNNARPTNISDLLQSVKGNFSREIHQGNIWQKRFYTRIINTQKYLETIIEYIKQNPIKAELPGKYHKKPYQYINWPAIRKLF